MKVSKQMLHEELRSNYRILSWFPAVLRFKWAIQLVNLLGRLFRRKPDIEGISCEERLVASSDGVYRIRLLVFRPENVDRQLPAMLYCHGGGYIMGDPEQAAELIERFIKARSCVVIAPDYRKSFTEPFPAGFNDCYETLLWAKANAAELNIFSEHFIVAGHSAGGGLTAAVSLKARDTQEVDIAFQMPIYPMIDDTQPSDPAREISTPVWDTRINAFGWGAYLSDLHAAGEDIPPYAAAARATDYRNLPPTITFVGTLEPFYWETGSYVESLRDAGVEVVYEEYEGCFHAFDLLAGKASVSKQALDFTFQQFAAFYDKFVPAHLEGSH